MTEDFKIMTAGDSEKISILDKINVNLSDINNTLSSLNGNKSAEVELLKQQNKLLRDIVLRMRNVV